MLKNAELHDVPFYYKSIDFEELVREYPPAPDYFRGVFMLSVEEIRELQERRLREAVARAYQVPFYKSKWDEAGIEPGDIKTIEDLKKAPMYTVEDIRQSVDAYPPFGDYVGRDVLAGEIPWRIHSSGGTAGEPRPTFYTPWDREVGNILRARSYYWHGFKPGDVVMNTLLYSTHNAAYSAHEALWQWLGCIPVTTSAGVVTRTTRALEIAQKWQVNALVGFPEYLLHMSQVAKDMGLEVGKDLKLKLVECFGKSDLVREAWGVPAYDTYGMHEVQAISSECPYAGGHHIWEDAFIVEIVDPDTYEPVEPGELGTMIVTALYKENYPIVRYDIKDVTRLWPQDQCECGSWMQKIDPIHGRSDFMVKLRGVNVWPEGVGTIVAAKSGLTGEYYCIVERMGNREEMTVQVEHTPEASDLDFIHRDLERTFRDRLNVGIKVEMVEPDSLAPLTGAGVLPKARRLDDRRKLS